MISWAAVPTMRGTPATRCSAISQSRRGSTVKVADRRPSTVADPGPAAAARPNVLPSGTNQWRRSSRPRSAPGPGVRVPAPTTTCTLVPVMPNELTPARPTRPSGSSMPPVPPVPSRPPTAAGVLSSGTKKGESTRSEDSDGATKDGCGGTVPVDSAPRATATESRPEAASR